MTTHATVDTRDVQSVLDSQIKGSATSRWIFILAFLALAADGLDTANLQYVAPTISKDLGITSTQMGIVFSVGFAGLLLGGIFLGPLADRRGRRPILLLGSIITAVGSAGTILVANLPELTIARLVTGIGLGASIPAALALVSDFAPTLRRSRRLILAGTGLTVGTIVSAPLSSALLPHLSWQGIFLVGTIVPAVTAVLVGVSLPGSPRWLVLRGRHGDALDVVRRLRLANPVTESTVLVAREEVRVAARVALFDGGRRGETLLLWAVYLLTFGGAYMTFSWIPTILATRGVATAVVGTTAIGLGVGSIVGALVLGLFARRRTSAVLLVVALLAAALAIPAFAVAGTVITALAGTYFAVGLTAGGAQTGLNGLAGDIYPPDVRSTGIGFAQSFGRLGSIIFPLIGGASLAGDPSGLTLFILATGAFVAAAIVLIVLTRFRSPANGAKSTAE
jgi:AAHS family 4-hydroxybenzoate transporter-like MFS transporter